MECARSKFSKQNKTRYRIFPPTAKSWRTPVTQFITLLYLLFRHVHIGCDPEAQDQLESKRFNHSAYVCKICRTGSRSGGGSSSSSSAAATAGSSSSTALATLSSASVKDEDSNDTWPTSMDVDEYDNGRLGIGKGKPMAMGAGKRGRRGFGMVGRPRVAGGLIAGLGASSSVTIVGTSATERAAALALAGSSGAAAGGASGGVPGTPGFISKPGQNLAEKRRSGEVRRRGRQPKIREMVGLSVSSESLLRFCPHFTVSFIFLVNQLFLASQSRSKCYGKRARRRREQNVVCCRE